MTVPTTNPNNNSEWDVGGGAPDLFLQIGGTKVTNAVQDQFSASFAGPFDLSLIAGATLRIDVYDEDLTTNDYATGCQAMPVSAALLRSRVFACSGGGVTFTSTIVPK